VERLTIEPVGTFEFALWCKLLRDRGFTGRQVARLLGKSEGYVNNLVRIVERGSLRVLERWSRENRTEHDTEHGNEHDTEHGNGHDTARGNEHGSQHHGEHRADHRGEHRIERRVCATDWLMQVCLLPHDVQDARLAERLAHIAL
jgi:hypothetical protein